MRTSSRCALQPTGSRSRRLQTYVPDFHAHYFDSFSLPRVDSDKIGSLGPSFSTSISTTDFVYVRSRPPRSGTITFRLHLPFLLHSFSPLTDSVVLNFPRLLIIRGFPLFSGHHLHRHICGSHVSFVCRSVIPCTLVHLSVYKDMYNYIESIIQSDANDFIGPPGHFMYALMIDKPYGSILAQPK